MVHHHHRRVSALDSFSSALLVAVLLLFPIAGCGGGGSSLGHVRGVLTGGFGSVIGFPEATVTLEGTGIVGHPDESGRFTLSSEAGTYVLAGVFTDVDAGIRLEGRREVILTRGQTLDVGFFMLSDASLQEGWAMYKQGRFTRAEQLFLTYLDSVRSGQVHLGTSSAYCGLGWTRGRGLERPVDGAVDFGKAIDGWSGNIDAWVGLAGCELSRMRSDGDFHFGNAVEVITMAINLPGEYSSAPVHDQIAEADLRAFRCFVNYLDGSTLEARNEAVSIEDLVAVSGNKAGADALAIVLAFTE